MALSSFSEVRLPTPIAFGSTFGPKFATSIAPADSGYDDRLPLWSQARHHGDLRYGVRTLSQLQDLYTFFRVRRGKAQGFRFKDHQDYTATRQFIAVGDGSGTLTYPLQKIYDSGPQQYQYVRRIMKPVGLDFPLGNTYDSVTFYLDDDPYDQLGLNYATGLVSLTTPLPTDSVLTWSGEFDVPVRFDTDWLPLSLALVGYGGTAEPIPIIELLADPDWPAELAT